MPSEFVSKNENKTANGAIKTSENADVCPKCGTSTAEILETGFVGCEKCYELPTIKQAVERMFGGKHHKN